MQKSILTGTILGAALLASISFSPAQPPPAPPAGAPPSAPGNPPPGAPRRGGGGAGPAVLEPYKGVSTNGEVVPGLYKIAATGVSTEPIKKAAEAFIASLTDEQRAKTVNPADTEKWRRWTNVHSAPRDGVSIREMSEAQRKLGMGLLAATLSAKGLKKAEDIMKLNETLAELQGDRSLTGYGEDLYWFAIFGTPSATEPWGFQFEGHHCVVHAFVLGDQLVMTPTFMGSEPNKAEAGKYKGLIVLEEELNAGLNFMRSLNEEQQGKARIALEKTGNNTLTEAYKDNVVIDFAGIKSTDLTDAQKKALIELVRIYATDIRPGHAEIKMAEVEKHFDETRFAWIGKTDDAAVFYYRIQSPVVIIEFDHQTPAFVNRAGGVQRLHVHTVVRTPNGNDYGKDLLRQHLLEHPH